MSEEHKSHKEILDEINKANSKIVVGTVYAHYKNPGRRYRIKGFGTLESTDELCVIYQAEYGEKLTFIRPVGGWLENLEWQGKTVPRFTKL